jgi:hypothetical protein
MPLTSPDGPQALPGPQMLVHRDPVRVGFHADRLKADPLHARAATGGHRQPVAPHLQPAVELQHILVTLPPRRGGVHPQDDLDAVPAQGLAQRLAQRRRLAGQQAVGALDEHRLAA